MKNLNFIFLLTSLLLAGGFASCSDETGTDISGDGKGAITLSPTLDEDPFDVTVGTREIISLTDFEGYTLTVKKGGSTVFTGEVPSDRTVGDLTPGSDYAVELSNYDPTSEPEESPRYSGSKSNISVIASSTPTPVDLRLAQANTGVYFTYDPSLAEHDLGDIYPEVKQGDYTIEYTTHDATERWYWHAGAITVTLYSDGEIVRVAGKTTQTLTLPAGQLWKIHLSAEESTTGSISISVTVTEITDPTNSEQWVVGPGDDTETFVIENPKTTGRWMGGGEFFLSIVTDSYKIHEVGYRSLSLHGFSDPAASFEEFSIKPGVYTVSENAGAPNTIQVGYYKENTTSPGTYMTWPSFVGWRDVVGVGGLKEIIMTEGTVTVEQVDEYTYTMTTDVTIESQDGSMCIENYRVTSTFPVILNNYGPDPGEDNEFGRGQGYAMMEMTRSAFQVNLIRHEDADYTRGITLEGYTDKQEIANFILTPGVYTISSTPGVNDLLPGSMDSQNVIYGTFAFRQGPMVFSDLWFAESGAAIVEYDSETEEYTINVTISGTHLINGQTSTYEPFSNNAYIFKGKIPFIDPEDY